MHVSVHELLNVALTLLISACAVGLSLAVFLLAIHQHTERLRHGLGRWRERIDHEGRLYSGLGRLEERLTPIEQLGERLKSQKDSKLGRWVEAIPLSADVMTLLRPLYLWIAVSRFGPFFQRQVDDVAQALGIFLLVYALSVVTNFRRERRFVPAIAMAILGGVTLAAAQASRLPYPHLWYGTMALIAWVFDLLDGPKASWEAERRGHPTRHGPYLDPIVDVICFTMMAYSLWQQYVPFVIILFTAGIGGRIGFSIVYQGFRWWREERLPRLLPESMAGKYKTAFLAASCVVIIYFPESSLGRWVANTWLVTASVLEFVSLTQQGVRAGRVWRNNALSLTPSTTTPK